MRRVAVQLPTVAFDYGPIVHAVDERYWSALSIKQVAHNAAVYI